MATLTINFLGVQDEKNTINLIMQQVQREGRMQIPTTNNPDRTMLMANRLVIYKILNIKVIQKTINNTATDFYEYSIGENFAKANLKGAYEFIIQEKSNLNPPRWKRFLNSLNNNQFISGLITGFVTTFLGGLALWYFTNQK